MTVPSITAAIVNCRTPAPAAGADADPHGVGRKITIGGGFHNDHRLGWHESLPLADSGTVVMGGKQTSAVCMQVLRARDRAEP